MLWSLRDTLVKDKGNYKLFKKTALSLTGGWQIKSQERTKQTHLVMICHVKLHPPCQVYPVRRMHRRISPGLQLSGDLKGEL